jgi:aquaporin Z
MRAALTHHWPEYLMEAAGLGIFMLAACTFATLLEHPASPMRQAISDPILRRMLMGLAMGLTAINLIYSPWENRIMDEINQAVAAILTKRYTVPEPRSVLIGITGIDDAGKR